MATRILLVEDNPGDAVIFREKLDASDLDYELVHAKRLAEGLEYLGDGHFDIMMVDLSLPDAHGMEAVVKVREAAPTHPLIVLTGLDDATAAAEAKQEGAVDYLVKWYVDSTSLARYIRYAIAQYEMNDREAKQRTTPPPAEVQEPEAKPVTVEGTVVAPRAGAAPAEAPAPPGGGAEALRAALEASAAAVLIVAAGGNRGIRERSGPGVGAGRGLPVGPGRRAEPDPAERAGPRAARHPDDVAGRRGMDGHAAACAERIQGRARSGPHGTRCARSATDGERPRHGGPRG